MMVPHSLGISQQILLSDREESRDDGGRLQRFFTRLLNFAAGRRADQRLREEMEEHLALVLLIAAGLLSRSFWDLYNVRLGFDPQDVMAMSLWLPSPNDPATDIYGTPR
jgi:hypothetical protein